MYILSKSIYLGDYHLDKVITKDDVQRNSYFGLVFTLVFISGNDNDE